MTPEKPDTDVGDVSAPEDRQRLVAETLAHVEVLEALYGKPPESTRVGRWKGALAVIVFALSGYLALDPPQWIVGAPPAGVSAQERVRGAASALALQAEAVEAFRLREGRLPLSLEELDVHLPDITLVRSNNRLYQLVAASPAGGALVYDAARPSALFRTASQGWSPPPPDGSR